MAYAVAFTRKAAEEFAVVPVDLAIAINKYLDVLGEDPINNSRKPYFPFRPGGLMSEFKEEMGDHTSYVRIFFHFGAGENTLVITGFSIQSISH